MNVPASAPLPANRVAFQDGLGIRLQLRHPASGAALEVLRFHRTLSDAPLFEFAVRERVSRLAGLDDACFARVRGIERTPAGDALLLVSNLVDGVRLSELVASPGRRPAWWDLETALCLIRQLVSALATLHGHAQPGIAHGAIGPERIVITPAGRLVIVEHVLGAGLEQMQYPSERYWHEFGVAVPARRGGFRFDQRVDVAQAGVVALCLLIGRPLDVSEYPSRIPHLVASASAESSQAGPVAAPLRSWLTRALQLDRRSFHSALEAWTDLEALLGGSPLAIPTTAESLAAPSDSAGPAEAGHHYAGALVVADESVRMARSRVTTLNLREPALARQSGPLTVLDHGEPPTTVIHVSGRITRRWPRRLALAAMLMICAGAGIFGWRRYFDSAPPAVHFDVPGTQAQGSLMAAAGVPAFSRWGQLEVRTDPTGAQVIVDGVPLGASPMRIDLSTGDHVVDLKAGERAVSQRVTIRPATTTSLVVPLAGPAQTFGWLSIAAAVEVEAYERGQLLGSSQSPRIMVAAGTHDLDIVNDVLGYRSSRTVRVGTGEVATVKIDFPAGRVTLTAIPSAEVWVDGTRVGETPINNLPVQLGPHEILFRHPELGERRHAVTVTLSQPVRLNVDLTRR